MAQVTIKDYLNNLTKVQEQLPDVVNDALLSNEAKIVELNRNQLYDGKTTKDENIRPLYSEDSFFKTKNQMEGYVAYKEKLIPNTKKNRYVPNLLINGFFYRSLKLVKQGKDIVIKSINAENLSDDLPNKYVNILGLNSENQKKVDNEISAPAIFELIKKYL